MRLHLYAEKATPKASPGSCQVIFGSYSGTLAFSAATAGQLDFPCVAYMSVILDNRGVVYKECALLLFLPQRGTIFVLALKKSRHNAAQGNGRGENGTHRGQPSTSTHLPFSHGAADCRVW